MKTSHFSWRSPIVPAEKRRGSRAAARRHTAIPVVDAASPRVSPLPGARRQHPAQLTKGATTSPEVVELAQAEAGIRFPSESRRYILSLLNVSLNPGLS